MSDPSVAGSADRMWWFHCPTNARSMRRRPALVVGVRLNGECAVRIQFEVESA